MSKKVLVFSGSPRKNGNLELLSDQFVLGAQDAGHEVEKITVADHKINYCIACDNCKRNPGQCIWQDDMAIILEK